MNFVRIASMTAGLALLVGSIVIMSTSCSQTPTNVPVRTFQQAQKVDLVCMAVNDENGNPLPATRLQPLPQNACPPVPINVATASFPRHLYAVVTQTTPGTLAVVDLTNGGIVDEDNATPGINFIPVGALPTDVAVSADGAMTFVSSAAPGEPAIYAIDNRHLLGTSTGNPTYPPLKLTDLPACALPQAPDALSISPTSGGEYVLLAMLRSEGRGGARIAAYDPAPLMRGAHVPTAPATDGGLVDPPGQLKPCTLLGSTVLADSSSLTSSFLPGPVWPDGVPYVDGGVDLEGSSPLPVPVVDGGVNVCAASSSQDAGIAWPPLPPTQASPAAMVLRNDKPILYVADGAVPVIHVVDVNDPASPQELAPLLATNVRNPAHVTGVGAIAISPPTRDYKRYLYAVDETDGTVMVYDVTDPVTSPHVPLQRPHADLNPLVPPDRLSFSAPVASVAFAEHDWLLPSQADTEHYYSGILCNPNPRAHPSASQFVAKGAYYRADQAGTIQNSGVVENFPTRLRGVFGFATLSNGSVVPIDVDDWDAPCRRPDPMAVGTVQDPQGNKYSGPANGKTGLLDIPEPAPSSSTDLDEYHVPLAYQRSISESAAVTLEAFFPVSAPNRIRSGSLLENDPSGGNHMPYVLSTPQYFDQNGSPVQVGGTLLSQPLLQPTPLDPGFIDPSVITNPTEPNPSSRTATPVIEPDAGGTGVAPNVRVSFDDPTAHVDQDWQVTFEGPLPASPVGPLNIDTTDGYQTLRLGNGTLGSPGAADGGPANGLSTPGFCGMGIEDWVIGSARTVAAGMPASAAFTSDYIEIADDLLPQSDSYWGEKIGLSCWQGTPLADDAKGNVGLARYAACADFFGAGGADAGTSGVGTLADMFLSRDFPIVQAFDDHLVVGRFGWHDKSEQTSNRVIVGADPGNVPFLKLAQCCFHNQATVKVRTGGEWVAVGQNGIGLLHHVQVGPGGACVLSCNSNDALKNARALDLSVASTTSHGACVIESASLPRSRNDGKALRTPMFSFFIEPAVGTPATCSAHSLVQRDSHWQFSMRGGFNPLSISISQGTSAGVSPQSMRFIEPFGQLAVVDGSQQGLVIIDLNTLALAHSPYF